MDSEGARAFGIPLLVIGLLVTAYFMLIYDITVSESNGYAPPEFDSRIVNLGRMNERIVGIIAGIGLSIVGTLLSLVKR